MSAGIAGIGYGTGQVTLTEVQRDKRITTGKMRILKDRRDGARKQDGKGVSVVQFSNGQIAFSRVPRGGTQESQPAAWIICTMALALSKALSIYDFNA